MLPRLEEYSANLDIYASHKLQDGHQSFAFADVMRNLGESEALCLIDYGAKSKPAKTTSTQNEGYGNAARISRHTATIVQRVLREDVQVGTSEEDRQEMFNVLTYNIVANNANQCSDHALQVVKATLKLHMSNPKNEHLSDAILWSDMAGDYTGTAFLYSMLILDTNQSTNINIRMHGHSIPGEGKAMNDMKNGIMNQRLKRLRRTGGVGSSQQTAAECVMAMDIANMSGVVNKEGIVATNDVTMAPGQSHVARSSMQ
ncbi:hypothetical protein CYMTET_4711 [Cymbomonas tetramitiformis]|uniref:Uncharacterized protein n=1 Tax=Cymbomonas tetramitiformis TaxID=36881 RepID=A0AAE0H0V1_9CHLO|nr:hypothetical protein CYMTET_4711 [Cymbomonas tetramitiformis]